MKHLSRFPWTLRAALGASLAFGAAPLAVAQPLYAEGADDDPSTLDPSIPYTAPGLSGGGKLDMGDHDLILTDAADIYTGTLSGGGALHITGGTQMLTGTNTYSGGTFVHASSAVAINQHAALGTGGLSLDGGALIVTKDMSTDREITLGVKGGLINTLDGVTLHQRGNIVGAGVLAKLGVGTLVVSGRNTFSGGTIIQGGTLRIDAGSSLGTGEILLEGGTLETEATLITEQPIFSSGSSGVDVEDGTTAVLAGNVQAAGGDACFGASGGGTLNLAGNANFRSGLCVHNSVLTVDGQLDSTLVQVDANGTLRGTGWISGDVNVEGRLAPGNGPGALTVEGGVTLQPGATLQVDIDGEGNGTGAGNYARLLVTGTDHVFVADGTLAPTLRGMTGDANNAYTPALGSTYRIVEAEGGVTGRFSAIEQPKEGLAANTRFVAFYGVDDGHAIDLRVTPSSYTDAVLLSGKGNAWEVARTMDTLLKANDSDTANERQVALLYKVTALGAADIAPLMHGLAGQVHSDAVAATSEAGFGIQRDIAGHLGTDTASDDASHRAWVNVGRGSRHVGADRQATGFDSNSDRTTVGFDLYNQHGTVVGIAASHDATRVNSQGGSARVRGNTGIVYARFAPGPYIVDAMAARGRTGWNTRRRDPLGNASLESRSSGHSTMASATLRVPMQTHGGHRIEPYGGLVWQKVGRDALTERGDAVTALGVGRLSATGTRLTTGVTLGSRGDEPLASTVTWRLGTALGTDWGALRGPTTHNTLAGQRFTSAAPQVGRGFSQLNAHGTVRVTQRSYLYGSLAAEIGSRRSAVGATAGVRVAF